jgi:hypothetical protein
MDRHQPNYPWRWTNAAYSATVVGDYAGMLSATLDEVNQKSQAFAMSIGPALIDKGRGDD